VTVRNPTGMERAEALSSPIRTRLTSRGTRIATVPSAPKLPWSPAAILGSSGMGQRARRGT